MWLCRALATGSQRSMWSLCCQAKEAEQAKDTLRLSPYALANLTGAIGVAARPAVSRDG